MTSNATSPQAARYLQLHLADGIGPITFGRLIEAFGDVDRILAASPAALTCVKGVGRKLAEAILAARDPEPAQRELALAVEHGVRIVCLADPDYPMILRHIADPPICLYVKGTLTQADAVSLGVVGSRRASTYGLEQARRFGQLLGQAGITVISGLARGIDSASHRGALDVGGRTIAVLGNGLTDIYPPEHAELADHIAANGAIVSELPMTTGPERGNFPARNRIIAGLGLGVLVVEGVNSSGALITARLATDYNREVFAIPGRVDVPNAVGPNTLIKDGQAKLVADLADILDELAHADRELSDANVKDVTKPKHRPAPAKLTDIEKHILTVLSHDEAIGIETICELSKLVPAQVASALTMLQLKGAVKQLHGTLFMSLVQP